MEENIKNLEIKGSGESKGGKYNTVIIEGEGVIVGDLDCVNMEIKGQCQVNGSAKAQSMKVHGHNSIKGDLKADKIDIHGEVEVNGDLSAGKAVTRGFISVNGNCNAESFTMEGMFRIRGLLNTDELELNLHGPSEAREIGGEKIAVRRNGKPRFTRLRKIITPLGFDTGLITDVIEGDEIYLEYTKANVVRGNNIELGPGCEIKILEYKNEFKQHDKTEVTTSKQL